MHHNIIAFKTAMASFSTDEKIEFVRLMEESIRIIQLEDEQGSSSVDMLLRQCEDILVYAQDLFPDDSGDAVVKAVSNVYKYLETRKYAPKRGRPSLDICSTQLEQLLSFFFVYGSFHAKSTQKMDDPLRFPRNLVCRQNLMTY